MPSLRITVIDHQEGARRQHRVFRSPLRIGRDPSNDLVLGEPFVARWQAVVTFDAETLTICVLSASNPLRRGGRALVTGSQVRLEAREVLTLGSLELRIEHRPEEGAAIARVRAGPACPEDGATIAGPEPDPPGVRESAAERARAALLRLRAEHLRVGAAIRAWEDDCARALADLEADARDPGADAAAGLLRRELAALDPFGGGAGPRGLPPLTEERLSAIGLVGELALELAPSRPPPSDAPTIRRFLSRVAASLKSFAAITVELQRIWADERRRLGVAEAGGRAGMRGPLELEAAELVAAMVDPGVAEPLAGEAVLDAAVGLQDHVRGLIQCAEEAGSEVVGRLAPVRFGDSRRGALTPWRGAAAWRAYRETYRSLCGEEGDGERVVETLRDVLRERYALMFAGRGEA